MEEQTQSAIVRAGIAAPSADNSQPWRFVWHDDVLELRIDANRSGSVSDTRYVLSDLAAGACLENMLVEAGALGYAAEVRTFPARADPLRVADMHWRRDDGVRDQPGSLAAFIAARHTDRRFPWGGAISDTTRARLTAQARDIPGSMLWWPRDRPQRRAALTVVRQAETLRFRSPSLHAELFSSIRFDCGWHDACAEGLAPATLAVERPMRPLFRGLRSPKAMARLNRLGAAWMLGWRSGWLPLRLSPGVCLVVVPDTSRESILAGGRALQRIWLEATACGLAVQPYAAAGVLSLGFVPVEPALQPAVLRLRAALEKLCGSGQGLVFLRLGRTRSAATHRSGRRTPASFNRTLE